MKKTRIVALALSALMMLSMAACGSSGSDSGSSAASGDVIKIGVMGPMTGSLAVYGNGISDGAKYAIDEINAAGGITVGDKVYTLEAVVKDDQGDPTECLNQFNSLIADGVQVVVGSATSGCTSAITSVANSEKVVICTPTGTADALTSELDFVFRTCFKDSFQGKLAAQYAKDQGISKVGIVYCSADTYSAGLSDAFEAACKDIGLDIVAKESVATMTEVDYTNQFTKMVSSGAELVFTPFYYDVMGPYVVLQARQVGFDGIILGGDGVDSTEGYVPEGADMSAFNNVYFTNIYAADLASSPVASNFVAGFTSAKGESPNVFAALAYDAVYVFKTAIENAQSVSGADIQAALADLSVKYDLVGGNYSFDETGTAQKDGVLMGFSYADGDAAVTKTAIQVLSLG